MDSGMIGKVAKAHRYAEESDRFTFTSLDVMVRGDNDDHRVSLSPDGWSCGCDFFAHHEACAHTMAIEQVLTGMLPLQVDAAVA